MIVLVTGGRDYRDRDHVFRTLDLVHTRHGIAMIVCGACPTGADEFALQWARYNEVDFKGMPAKFRTGAHGRGEGPRRNQRMHDLERPDVVIAFAGNTGTANMISIAEKGGTTVWRS